HGQTFTVEVLEELGFPREISVAPGTETTDREVPVDAHAPHLVGDSASERFDARDVFTPLPECLPSDRRHPREVPPNVQHICGLHRIRSDQSTFENCTSPLEVRPSAIQPLRR